MLYIFMLMKVTYNYIGKFINFIRGIPIYLIKTLSTDWNITIFNLHKSLHFQMTFKLIIK